MRKDPLESLQQLLVMERKDRLQRLYSGNQKQKCTPDDLRVYPVGSKVPLWTNFVRWEWPDMRGMPAIWSLRVHQLIPTPRSLSNFREWRPNAVDERFNSFDLDEYTMTEMTSVVLESGWRSEYDPVRNKQTLVSQLESCGYGIDAIFPKTTDLISHETKFARGWICSITLPSGLEVNLRKLKHLDELLKAIHKGRQGSGDLTNGNRAGGDRFTIDELKSAAAKLKSKNRAAGVAAFELIKELARERNSLKSSL